ncbi:MAG: amidohydrolase [Solobacterium sp.]|nr:amidohydrolase [Solobacterium sp.]
MQRRYFQKPVQRIDIHVHLGMDDECFNAEERMQFDAMMGIEHSILLPYPIEDAIQTQTIMNTDSVIEVVKRYPEHYSFFCNIDPNERNIEEKLKEYKALGAKGVGEFATKIPFDDERMDRIYEACAKLDLPILFHISPSGRSAYGIIDHKGLPLLEKVLQKHPNTIFIGHSQPFWYELAVYDTSIPDEALNGFPFSKVKEEGKVVELMRKYPNLYADLSANSGSNAILRDEEYGLYFLHEFTDRLFFGSDLLNTKDVIFPIGQMLDYYLFSGKLEEDVYIKICKENAEKMILNKE